MAKSSNTGMLIGLAVAGGAAYYAYTQGWLATLGLCPTGTTPGSNMFPFCACPNGSAGPPCTASAVPAAIAVLPAASAAASTPRSAPAGTITVSANSTPAQIAAALLAQNPGPGTPLPAGVTPSLVAQGLTAQQIGAQSGVPFSGLFPGMAGMGRYAVITPRRTIVHFPKKHVTVVLPRNYHVKGAA